MARSSRESLTPKILVVSDDDLTLKSCAEVLESQGNLITTSRDGADAVEQCKLQEFELVITDAKMPGMDGLEVLRYIKQYFARIEVVLMLSATDLPTAMEAIRSGAFDYIQKPFTPEELLLVVNNALRRGRLEMENRGLREQLERRYNMEDAIGNSEPMRRVYTQARKAAQRSRPVLLVGEVGSGKELIARIIHYNSGRAARQFVLGDCSSLPPSLVGSELFGRTRATPAGTSSKAGLIECAHEGTLFIDEISVLSQDSQEKLLRFMNTGAFEPVGAEGDIHADVRIIAATKINPEKLVAEKKLNKDLFALFNECVIDIPSLRERKEDIPILANHFLVQFSEEFGKNIGGFAHEAMHTIMSYDWPGNVRGLKNAVEQAALLATEDRIHPEDLPQHFTEHARSGDPVFTVPASNDELKKAKNRLNRRLERQFVIEALRRNNWNVTRAASETGLARPNFHALMRRYEITAPKNTD